MTEEKQPTLEEVVEMVIRDGADTLNAISRQAGCTGTSARKYADKLVAAGRVRVDLVPLFTPKHNRKLPVNMLRREYRPIT